MTQHPDARRTLGVAAIKDGIRTLGLSGRPVCVHSSLRSFGQPVERGADGILDAFLDEGCTVLVPTFSWVFSIPPPPEQRPARNAFDYSRSNEAWRALVTKRRLDRAGDLIYTPETNEIDGDMGALPNALLQRRERERGDHPLNSFAALGRLAAELVRDQRPLDVYAPLEALASADGAVLLIGVGLDRMTLLHAAEKRSGRNLFRRWSKDRDGTPMAVQTGSCSRGFPRLEHLLSDLATEVHVGKSRWRAFPADAVLERAANAIRDEPSITRCTDPECERCRDAVLGGPLL